MSDEVKATEEVVSPPLEEPTVESLKFVSEVVLPTTGDKVMVKKLKAGKYYEASKLYASWIDTLQQILKLSKTSVKDAIGKDGQVDEDKLKEKITKDATFDVSEALVYVDKASGLRLELLAVCLESAVDDLKEKYYPEDIEVLLEEAIKLNNFLDNVKKSVAPVVAGAKKKKIT